MFKRKKPQPRQNDTPPPQSSPSGDDTLPLAEQRFLEGFEKMVHQSKKPVDATEELRRERRQEYEKIADDFQPSSSLYSSGRQPRGSKAPAASAGKPAEQPADNQAANPGESGYNPRTDPRNREFYRRLGRTPSGTPPAGTRMNVAPVATPEPADGQTPTANGSLQPGAIVQFDDSSIAVYKDAVSGKDYALFYFLEQDMTLAPRGIFLEQYEMTPIGQLPADVLQRMAASRRWDRDEVVFHLTKFEYAQAIRQLLLGNAGQGPGEAMAPRAPQAPQPSAPMQTVMESAEAQTDEAPEFAPTEGGGQMHVRGRQIRINVGGRVWESIYWTSDEIGPIVAHHTNREWALMHLDLGRFQDAIEYGNVLPERDLKAIAKSLAKHA